RGEFTLGVRASLGLARADVDPVRARLEQAAGDHQADATGATGHDRRFAGQVEQIHELPALSHSPSSTCLSRVRSAATAPTSAPKSSSVKPGRRLSVNTTSHPRSSAITRSGMYRTSPEGNVT